MLKFQFTLPRGERLKAISLQPEGRGFNSRSREGSDFARLLYLQGEERFNSRSREGSDLSIPLVDGDRAVSIHAPARGATVCSFGAIILDSVSIHAPARGATYRSVLRLWSSRSFNSRSREGSDFDSFASSCFCSCFNSRSREGSDAIFDIFGKR